MSNEFVLLVDDDPDIHPIVEQALDGLARLVCVTSAEVATRHLPSEPTVVLVDLELGGRVRGDEFVDRVVADSPMSTVIVLSGVRDTARAVDLMRRGAEDYLVKPVQAFELRRRVERALTRRRLVAAADAPIAVSSSPSLELLRHSESAARVVLDIGVHLGKPRLDGTGEWDFDYAFDFMKSNVNMNEPFVRFEVNRYFGWPGQAPSYKIGQRIFEQIRDAAKEAEGAAFDLKSFHSRVLNIGGVGLDTLRGAVLRGA